jgi:hypothetical protein
LCTQLNSSPLRTKPGRHDIAEILLKVALKTQKIYQSGILLIEFEDDITIKIYGKKG